MQQTDRVVGAGRIPWSFTWAALRVSPVAPRRFALHETGKLRLLYHVFDRRHQRAATSVTTNLPFKEWGKLFHNAAAAFAIADRGVHKGILIRIAGKSRRSDQEIE